MFRYGADYYPEHWPEERWAIDARLMQDAGFNVVRLAEFAWSRMEPAEGQYDFAWLDRAIDVLAEHDIEVVLGTPTASPPPWLMTQHPDIFNVWPDGVRATYGARRTTCPTHPQYRAYAERITHAMAEHYHTHPQVIGWQIDNEFGDACYCEICRAAFHAWLENHYGSLNALNAAWGTDFWSHVYTAWAQIPMPALTARTPLGTDMNIVANPGLALDFARFVSDAYVDFQNAQLGVLRALCPDHFVTHNFMGFGYDKLNYFDLARPLDLVTWDNYPRGFWNVEDKKLPAELALEHDTMYGLKNQPFWVMEAQSGRSGWHIMGSVPRPGELRLWAYQAVAHGADAIVFFRWRSCRVGTEQLWQGILDHDGIPRRRYREIKQMGEELRRIGDRIRGAEVRAKAAIMLSYDSRFALLTQPNSRAFSYPQHVRDYYAALHRQNIPTAVVAPGADLDDYRLLVVPALYITEEATAANLRHFVEQGGTLILTARSGFKNHHNAVVDRPLPGLLAELCGIEIEDMDVLREGQQRRICFESAADPGAATALCEVLALKGAESLACYAEDYYADQPAAAINTVGQGKVIYVGTVGDFVLVSHVVNLALQLTQLTPLVKTPPGVEVTRRFQNGSELLFILNHVSEAQSFHLDGEYQDLFSNTSKTGNISLAAYDVLILGRAVG
jgi:beta-galactosidase